MITSGANCTKSALPCKALCGFTTYGVFAHGILRQVAPWACRPTRASLRAYSRCAVCTAKPAPSLALALSPPLSRRRRINPSSFFPRVAVGIPAARRCRNHVRGRPPAGPPASGKDMLCLAAPRASTDALPAADTPAGKGRRKGFSWRGLVQYAG